MKGPNAGCAVLLVLCSSAAAQQDAALRRVFARYDRNADGAVSRAEFPGSQAQYRAMDRNADGRVTFEEFARSAVARRILASRERDRREPRPRLGTSEEDLLRRLDAVLRAARGKVRRSAWRGAGVAFTMLDLDRNGVLDTKDRAAAARRARAAARPARPAFPPIHSPLPSPEKLLERHDENRDGALEPREVAGSKLSAALPFADTDGDGRLDGRELSRLVGMVNARIARRNAGDAKPRAPIIPFSSWDRDGDGRLSQKEWRGYPRLFPRIDADRDGHVTRAEIERFKRAIEGESFLERFDLDGDGKVTFSEFAGPREAFRRADRNGDGVVNGADRR